VQFVIPDSEWKPWIGQKYASAWNAALKELSVDTPMDYTDLVPLMMEAGPLVRKSVINLLQRAIAQGVLKRMSIYDFRTGLGPSVIIDIDNCDPEIYSAWMDQPIKTGPDAWKKQRRVDKKIAKSDPLEGKWDGDGTRLMPKPKETKPVMEIREIPGHTFYNFHYQTGAPQYKNNETGQIVSFAIEKQKKKKKEKSG
jgi:hypothetical protein